MLEELWQLRDKLLTRMNADDPVIYRREPESEYERMRRPWVQARRDFVNAAMAELKRIGERA